MGTYYYAIGKNSRDAYELGKNSFESIQNRKFESEEELAAVLVTHFREGFYDHSQIDDDYARQVAKELFAMDNEFEVVSDTYPASLYQGIVIVGSRFLDKAYVGALLSEFLED